MDLENLLGLQRTLCAAVNSEKLGLQPRNERVASLFA
jgi:hypothetical protein